MQRKLVKQGVNALTLTLPHRWIKEKGLQSGDVVDIKTTNTSLLITSNTSPPKKEALLEITSNDSRYIQYLLNNYYRAGYDKITLQGEISQKKVQESLPLLMGFSISESSANRIIIENLTEPASHKGDVILKQIFFIIKQDFKDIIEHLKKNTPFDFTHLAMNSDRAVMNANLCLRLFSKKSEDTNGFYWMITNLVTWIHRQLYYLVKNIGKQKRALNKERLLFFDDVAASFDHLYEGIFNKSLEEFHHIHSSYTKYEDKWSKLLIHASSTTTIIMQRFIQIHQFIFRATSSGIGINILPD